MIHLATVFKVCYTFQKCNYSEPMGEVTTMSE